jgi:hypothetical protein
LVQVKRHRTGKPRHRASTLSSSAGMLPLPIRNADQPKVSVIIPVMNECKSVQAVIRHSRSVHPDTEVIVVANGSTDGTRGLAEAAGARMIYYQEPLGHDVGRSIGALHAKGEVLLFTDGDIVIPGSVLRRFVDTILGGADVALNSYSGTVDRKQVHSVVLAKYALNVLLSKPQLKGMSMTAIPHALSRNAVERIGWEHLSVPPMAHAMAVAYGLKVEAATLVEVGRSNPPRRSRRRSGRDPLENLIIGDHIEAMGWLLNQAGPRAGHPDQMRRRDVIR